MNEDEIKAEERRKAWEAYLKKQQANAPRAALREAILNDETSEESSSTRRGSIDGSGTIQIIFDPPPAGSRWTVGNPEQPDEVSSGGVRATVRQDRDGQN